MPTQVSLLRLSRRSLSYNLRSYFWVLLSCAAGTAVITGALLVGDSVRGSLASRVEERLGRVDLALVTGRFFREDLSADIVQDPKARDIIDAAVPALILSGTVIHATSDRRVGSVTVLGVPEAFWSFSREPLSGMQDLLDGRRGIANRSLSEAAGAAAGDALLVHFEKREEIPAEHALGRKGGTAPPLRLELSKVLPDAGLGSFDLKQTQVTSRNIFVSLDLLQRALGRQGLANAILVASRSAASDGSEIDGILRRVWKLEDAGLRIRVNGELGYAALETRELLLAAPVVRASREAARALGAESLEVLTHIANKLALGNREIPYSTIAAVGPWKGPVPGKETSFLPVGPREIALNAWAADDLQAKVGDQIRVAYYAVTPELEETETALTLRAIVPLEGVARDPGWTPEYPGVSDVRRIQDWDPPFPIDMKRIRDRDEAYWDQFRATPKAFVSLEEGRRLWSSRFGDLTSIRFRLPSGGSVGALASGLTKEILRALEPASLGFAFRPVKAEGLESASGGTDFGALFLSFSFFLILSSLILLSMVFRLTCEGRAKELGILQAVGFSPSLLRRVLLVDAGLVALPGTALGIAGGLGYAAALIAGLRTWWGDAVNAPFLSLHARWTSLIAGAAITMILSLLTMDLVARRMSRLAPRSLLGGSSPLEFRRGRADARWSLWVAAGFALPAALLLVGGSLSQWLKPQVAFFGAGACLLTSGMAVVSYRLRSLRGSILGRKRRLALVRVGIRYGGRYPTRSLLTSMLIASATFVIVTVAGSQQGRKEGPPRKDSGDGGFALVGRSAIPLTLSLTTPGGREALNLGAETKQPLSRSEVFAFRLHAGDDASCLNLYAPRSPRILGVPREFVERGGFAWSSHLATDQSPWSLLDKTFADGAVPAVGDASTVTWMLHSGLGNDVKIDGGRVTLRIVGLLEHSIFQGELLVSEARFLEAFPRTVGSNVFLLDVPERDAAALSGALAADLAKYGLDVETTADLLATFQRVENTYLSTFQVLGGLGLLLGTLGLGAVLARNVNERRRELALLRAVGFSGSAISWIVLSETTFLLAAGLLVGAISAVVSLVPSVARSAGEVSWPALAASLGVVFLAGLLSSSVALRSALRFPVMETLRRD